MSSTLFAFIASVVYRTLFSLMRFIMKTTILIIAGILSFLGIRVLGDTLDNEINNGSFPENFIFGVATAAYQIEGAWNESDKSESIWDYLVHNYPELIEDGTNADVACDSYHHLEDDIQMMKNLNLNFYRFSLSWTRLLPDGFATKVSETGLKYYNDLIDGLLANDIQPMITLYHWDLPSKLQELGGFVNPIMGNYFAEYAKVAFEKFGDRVKYWITFNEPAGICSAHAESDYAPVTVRINGVADYLCHRVILLAHAKTYRLYNETFKETQQGQVGITLSTTWYEPATEADAVAQNRILQAEVGIYGHPIFIGDWPEVTKERVANRSAAEGYPRSRLPELTEEEIDYIKGTADFLGINHYSSYYVQDIEEPEIGEPATWYDKKVSTWKDPSWETSNMDWLTVNPWGFTKLLKWVSDQYNQPTILVTENGYSDEGQLGDTARINYLRKYLSAILDAIDQGVNVVGYAVWSLMDNFEWLHGYTNHFGLYTVNFSDPARPRTAKQSATYYKNVIKSRVVTVN